MPLYTRDYRNAASFELETQWFDNSDPPVTTLPFWGYNARSASSLFCFRPWPRAVEAFALRCSRMTMRVCV